MVETEGRSSVRVEIRDKDGTIVFTHGGDIRSVVIMQVILSNIKRELLNGFDITITHVR